jgi:hypothetical protein
LYLDPLIRAVSIINLGRQNEAKAAVGELLKLVPDFAARGRRMLRCYVKADGLVETIIAGLRKAGLDDIE